jgi:murein DD-endopeptidase MepM/ murein hydrolase activator NlpD
MPDRPLPTNRQSFALLDTAAPATRYDSYYKLALLSGFMLLAGTEWTVWHSAPFDRLSSHHTLTLPAPATSYRGGADLQANSMRAPPLAFLDREGTHWPTSRNRAATTPPNHAAPPAGRRPADGWSTLTLERGDNLRRILTRSEIDTQDLRDLLELPKVHRDLARLHPGETLKLRTDHNRSLQELIYRFDEGWTLHVTRNAGRFLAAEIPQEMETRTRQVSGTIERSLFEAAQASGLGDRVTTELSDIFARDIDFALDVRPGDRFAVLYEEHYLAGEKVDDGDILAAAFTNRGRTYRAVRYADPDGHMDYYTPDGYRLDQPLLRTPVEFSYISSGFTLSRYDPVLHRFRAHTGVDYAAPTGTPVKAAGNGRIDFAGVDGGYGKMVLIQHGDRYSTLYGHLSHIATGLAPGTRVHQGEIIGYVGQTGLATGPHLHYELRIDGVPQDPLTVKLPLSEPIPPERRRDFVQAARELLAQVQAPARLALSASTTPN